MDGVLLAVALLTVLAAGIGWRMLLAPARQPVGWIELLGHALVLGPTFVSLAGFCLGLLLSGPRLQAAVALACLALAGFGMRSRGLRQIVWPEPAPVGAVLTGLLAIQVGIVGWLAMHQAFGWDGLFVWELKARLACLNDGAVPLAYFSDGSRQWSHPRYPLLVPLTESWLYAWLGRCHQQWGKSVFVLFYVAALGLIYAGILKVSREPWRAWLAALLIFFIPLVIENASTGHPDFVLGVAYLGAVFALFEYWETGATADLLVLASLSGFLVWIKQEGVVLWACIVLAAAARILARRRLRDLPALMLPGAALYGGWRLFLALAGAPPGAAFVPVTLETLWANLGRIPIIASAVVHEMLDVQHWGPLWLAIPLALPALRSRRSRAPLLVGLFLIVAPAAVYAGTYVFSAWSPFTDHLNTSLSRLMVPLSLVAVVMAALAVPGRRHLRSDPLGADVLPR